MNQYLYQFLSKFKQLRENEVLELAASLKVVEVEKGTVLVKEGQVCKLCYFVLKGCLRQYYLLEGVEKTIALYTEEQAINYYSNQQEQAASDTYLSTLEKSVLLVGDPEKDQALYSQFPVLVDITRAMMEEDFGKTQNSFAKFMISSPEERYVNLMNERPDLLQRVPQTIIASYIGITPESLSRMRRRLYNK